MNREDYRHWLQLRGWWVFYKGEHRCLTPNGWFRIWVFDDCIQVDENGKHGRWKKLLTVPFSEVMFQGQRMILGGVFYVEQGNAGYIKN